ncbi:glutaredoxin family protein [Bacillus hominis]|uniref:glutaredoxin family protein n=1 Tax=Bacillus hominis TaxID=2817478 RepID=UPI001BB407F3|nr:glutaredoxin family protein [Bacillus hominis]
METKIIMFTGNTCSKCMRAKAMLNNTPPGIEFELIERNVDENESDMEFLTKKLKSNSLPTFLINPEEGSTDYKPLIGFDENIGKIMKAIGL